MTKRIPCEQDLKSSDLNRYGWAAAQCQNASQDCLADGFCHYEGHCFENKGWTHEEALVEVERLTKQLDETKTQFHQYRARHLHLVMSIKANINNAIRNSNDTAVFVLRQCLTALERIK